MKTYVKIDAKLAAEMAAKVVVDIKAERDARKKVVLAKARAYLERPRFFERLFRVTPKSPTDVQVENFVQHDPDFAYRWHRAKVFARKHEDLAYRIMLAARFSDTLWITTEDLERIYDSERIQSP